MTASTAQSGTELSPPQPLLPRYSRSDRPLAVIMGVMAFLAGLALLTSIWAAQAGRIWTSGLDGQMTVQVMDAAQTGQAINVIEGAGLTASALSDDELDALLAPWLGNAQLPDDIPVPALVRVDGATDAQALAGALQRAGVEAEVDDHQRWASRVRSLSFWTRVGAAAVLSIIFAAGAATSAFATEAAMRAEETIVRVLGQVGAQDDFVAKLFISRFFFQGLKAGVAGAIGAGLFGLVLGVLFGPPFGIGWTAVLWLAVLPIAFGFIAAASAGWMTIGQLRADRAAL